MRKTNVTLWVLQSLLAALFAFAGVSKLLMPAAELAKQSPLPAVFIQFIGVCEALGALGLVLPWALKIRPVLTPVAAAGLVIIMVGATVLSAPLGAGAAAVPFVAGVLCAVVAVVRGRSLAANGGLGLSAKATTSPLQ